MQSYVNFVDNYLSGILAAGAVVLCGLLVISFLVVPYVLAMKTYKLHKWLEQNGKIAEGTVVTLFTRMSRAGAWTEKEYAQYSFLTEENRTFTGEFSQRRKNPFPLESKVKVYYNPLNPEENCTQDNIKEEHLFHILFLAGIIFMAIVIVVTAICVALV
ncbi:MAG: DUF3592 domain-containing protein [Eubacteriales bacterium]|nr:DUF3592 domain-containing protein [Eubacteriales bacterium]